MTALDLREPKIVPEAKVAEPATPISQSINTQRGSADDLKKYKDLLDMGAITQEEFDAKKREILGL